MYNKQKILLLLPDARMHKLRIGKFIKSMREAPLTLASLAALAPEKLDLDFKLVDGSIDTIPLDDTPDLVGISVMTGTANEAYRIADHFRSRNIPVILGGVHVTVCQEEASRHADSVVVGMAEKSWKELLNDFVDGRLKTVYNEIPSINPWLESIPSPKLDLIRRSGYMIPNSIQATRGCSKKCDFCSVPSVWKRFQKRPVADVIRDIQKCKGRYIGFGDVNLIDDIEYAKELFSAMIPLKKNWGGLATTELLNEPEMFDLMVKSGCRFLLIGFESVNQLSLNHIAKGFNSYDNYSELVSMLHKNGISVQGCLVFGFDYDDHDVFEKTVQTVHDLKIDIPRYSIYTPYPGTRLFSRLESEGRIVSYNWDDYDTMHVVFEPEQMSCDQLYAGFKWSYRETFKIRRIFQRTFTFDLSCPINIVGNLAYKLFVKRLYNEERFKEPYSIESRFRNLDLESSVGITGKAAVCRM